MSSSTVWSFLLSICTVCLVPGERLFRGLEGGSGALARDELNNGSQLTSWSLFGESGPSFSDVKGASSGCHYLAGLAAIAWHHPELIEEAFIMRGETSPTGAKVYQVKFLIDGIEIIVALDEQVPTDFHGNGFILATVPGQAVWPVLLEKGLAKLSGSYDALLKGLDPFTALTQAPVDIFRKQYSPSTRRRQGEFDWIRKSRMKRYLTTASERNYPVVARSVKGRWLKAGRNVHVVGPKKNYWFLGLDPLRKESEKPYSRGDWYEKKGPSYTSLARTSHNLWLSEREFLEQFERVDVAKVHTGHRISLVRIPVGEPVALKFTITEKDGFAVQLQWPTERLTRAQGCNLGPGNVKLLVRQEGRGKWMSGAAAQLPEPLKLRVDLEDPGTYLVYAYFSFSGMPVTSEVTVSVYAGQDVTFERLSDPLAVGREILGFPCTFLAWPHSGCSHCGSVENVFKAVPFPLGGSPAWKMRGGKTVLWHNDTSLTSSSSIDKLDQMAEDIPLNKLKCLPEGSYGESPEDKVEQTEEVKKKLCGWQIGDQLLYKEKSCCEVVGVHPDVRGRRAFGVLELGYKFPRQVLKVPCSAPLKRVSPCLFSEGDQVEFRDGQEWVGDQVTKLGCGEVTLLKGGKKSCEKDQLHHSCAAYKDEEEVSVWDDELKQWHFAEAKDVNGSQVTVLYKGKTLELPCSDNDRLRKVSKCDKVAREQIKRLKELNNIDEIWTNGRDSVFPTGFSSIGGNDYYIDRISKWRRISDILS